MTATSHAIQLMQTPHAPLLRAWGVSAERVPGHRQPRVLPHGHDVVEFFYILGGSGIHSHQNRERDLAPGDMGMVRLGESHCIVTPRDPMDVLNIYIAPASFARFGLQPALLRLLSRLASGAPGEDAPLPHTWTPSNGAVVSQLLSSIARESGERRPGYPQAIELYVRLLLLECLRDQLEDDHATGHPSVQRALEFLSRKWREPVTVDHIAEHARISKFHLCRLFRNETGVTLLDHLHHLRVQHAMRMLTESNDKVIFIAHDSGFGDLAYFNKVFKRQTGLAPAAFRQKARSGMDATFNPNGIRKPS